MFGRKKELRTKRGLQWLVLEDSPSPNSREVLKMWSEKQPRGVYQFIWSAVKCSCVPFNLCTPNLKWGWNNQTLKKSKAMKLKKRRPTISRDGPFLLKTLHFWNTASSVLSGQRQPFCSPPWLHHWKMHRLLRQLWGTAAEFQRSIETWLCSPPSWVWLADWLPSSWDTVIQTDTLANVYTCTHTQAVENPSYQQRPDWSLPRASQ